MSVFSSLNSVFPTSNGVIHFIGIGGIGMSGIAEILHTLGYKVQGSDSLENYVTERLKSLGIQVFPSHLPQNIEKASLVVKSTAIRDDNPEIIKALELEIPIIKRSEMLAEIMRFKPSISISGTHGKTTTTAMIANLLEHAQLNPTVINGGVIDKKGTNAYLGEGRFLVAEADESDGTFIKVPSYVAVITNIDPEHLDYYKTFENAISAYRTFVNNLPFYGFGVLCYDHPIVSQLGRSITERKIISYGVHEENVDIKAFNIRVEEKGMRFDVKISEKYATRLGLNFDMLPNIDLGMHGVHNVSNSLAAVAVGLELGISGSEISDSFKNIWGVKRRFTKTGEVNGISIIDDYAHHPVEIEATLATARQIADKRGSKVIAIAQPHRYTRVRDLIQEFSTCFKAADQVFIADIYAAGEAPIPAISSENLVSRVSWYHKNVSHLTDIEELPKIIKDVAKPFDIVIFLGAGNITKWAYDLPKQLEQTYAKSA